MANKTTSQRITLRAEGTPVKLSGTVIKSDPCGKQLTVQFDGPIEDTEFIAVSNRQLVSHGLTKERQPTLNYKLMVHCQYWEVI